MTEILNQKHIITSPFNEKLFIKSLQSQLSSAVFRELINKEKESIEVTIIMKVKD